MNLNSGPDTTRLSNEAWSPERVVAAFDGEGPHAEILNLLEKLDRRDLFLNLGYSRSWHRHWGGKAQHRLVDRLAKRLNKYSKLDPVLLDIGCGRGGPAIRFREKWEMKVTGVDLSERNVEMARRKARDLAITEGLLFRKADATKLPFESESYTRVTAIESTEYIRVKRKAVSEIQRVLKPGGAVAVAAVLLNDDALQANPDHASTLQNFLAEWDFHDIGTESSYRDMFTEVGLRIKRFENATDRTLRPHRRGLKVLSSLLHNRASYPLIRRYLRKKAEVDVDPIRSQVKVAVEAIDAGLLKYGLFWATKS